jgi:5-amino-6-(5-phosphoribosylamino)uracil reductase
MSADGKIADVTRSPARFGSDADKAHLEQQVALNDGVLFGAGTLRAYGTTLRVSQPELLEMRSQAKKPPQPVQIVCSRFAEFDPELRFFEQPVPRWLLTTAIGSSQWQGRSQFERVLVAETADQELDWIHAFQQLGSLGVQRLAILGGGELVASLLSLDLIDELQLTVCPLLLGGAIAPTPVQGAGFLAAVAPRLELLSVERVDQEVFLHYRLQRSKD